jgi:Fusaric acid resistance protein-like
MAEPLQLRVRDLLEVHPGPWAHRVALRAGISVLVPLLAVLALGHPEWSAYAAFGAFTLLYGRNHVHLSRATMQMSAGTLLVAAVTAGALVGTLESRAWVAVGVAAVLAVLGSLVSAVQDWHPPGPIFLVFGFGAVASVPHTLADVPVAVVVAAASAGFALLVGNAGALLRRQHSRPDPLAPPRPAEALRCGLAVLLAGGTATAIGIGHPYWAMVAAAVPLAAPALRSQLLRAGHRVLGTLLGLVTSAALLAPGFGPLTTVLLVAVLQIVTELVVGRHYGVALLFITPMAMLIGQLVAPLPVGTLLFDRGVETVIGAAIGTLLIVIPELVRRRRGTVARSRCTDLVTVETTMQSSRRS